MAALLLLLVAARQVVVNLRTPGAHQPVAVGAVAGVAILALHAHADVVMEVRGLAVGCLLVAGYALWREDIPGRPTESSIVHAAGADGVRFRHRTVARAGVFLAVAVGLASVVPGARAELAAWSLSRSLATEGAVAETAARDAVTLDPGLVPAHLRVARLAASAGDTGRARTSLEAAIALEPLAQHEVELAVLLVSDGDLVGARQALDRALDRGGSDPFVHLNAAALAPALGRDPVPRLADSVLLEPGLLALLLMPAEGFPMADQDVRARATAAAAERAAGAGDWAQVLRIAAWSGDRVAAAELEGRLEDPYLRTIAAAIAGDATAVEQVADRTLQAPIAADYPWWAWLLAMLRCDEVEARYWAQLRMVVASRPPEAPVRLARAPFVGAASTPSGYPSGIWGIGPDPVGYVPGTWTWEIGTPFCRP